jgi:hypothetical protein
MTAKSPAEAQAESDQLFPLAVRDSNLRLWRPGDPIPSRGTRLLVGIATWSGYDLRLLDVLDELVAQHRANKLVIEVFNTAGLLPEELNSYIPGLSSPHHTPFVGVWIDGALQQKASGYEGRKIAAQLLGFDADEIVAFVRLGQSSSPVRPSPATSS